MFKTTFVNEGYRPLPMAVGFGVNAIVIAVVWLWPILALKRLDLQLATPSPRIIRLTARLKPVKPPLSTARLSSTQNTVAPTARPGSREWLAHVERGRELSFDIYAERSLPVLRAYGITLAIDTARPRGMTYLYDLGSKTYTRGQLPDNVIVRELSDLPPSPDIDEVRLRTERELGGKARIFALYPNDLYSALRSYTEEVLHKAAIPLETLALARVQLRLVNGKDFLVLLVGHS